MEKERKEVQKWRWDFVVAVDVVAADVVVADVVAADVVAADAAVEWKTVRHLINDFFALSTHTFTNIHAFSFCISHTHV